MLTKGIVVGLVITGTFAAPTTFLGGDIGAGSTDPRPLSTATASAFDTTAGSLGPISLIDFESVPVGPFSTLTLAPGVTLTGVDSGGANQEIRNSPSGSPDALFGYNTTAGGKNFASFHGGTMTFNFATPIQAFGAYFSGTELAGETIKFSDGTSQTINLLDLGSTGGIQFAGFTDAGNLVSSVQINVQVRETGDLVGMDDVRFIAAATVPDFGSSFGLLSLGLGALILARRRG